MQFEMELNSKLEGTKQRGKDEMDGMKEGRKDMRVDRQAGHQMNLAAMKEQQKTEGEPLKKFESSGNDILSGDAGMERYGL